MKILTLASLAVVAAVALCRTSPKPSVTVNDGPNDRVELGQVSWQRDLEAAKRESKVTGKPVFVLFQEVPG